MTPSYGPLLAIQLLSKTFLSKVHSLWNIRPVRDFLNTLYNKLIFHTYRYTYHKYAYTRMILSLKAFCTSKRLIVYARCERRDKIALHVCCTHTYMSLNVLWRKMKNKNSDAIIISQDWLHQTDRNRKLVFIFYHKSAVRFFISFNSWDILIESLF